MASVTTWTRLEPTPRQALMAETLRARIYDPLWMLARQWQLGEFQGEDAGSPVVASLSGECAQLTRFTAGVPARPVEGGRFDPVDIPIECLVERERVTPRADVIEGLSFAAEAGQQFLRMLGRESFGQRYHAAFTAHFPLPVLAADEAAARRKDLRFLALMAGRVPHGALLAQALRQPALPPGLRIEPGHLPLVQKVGARFVRWYDGLFSEPAGEPSDALTWSSRRMEYAFTVAGPTPGPAGAPTGDETVLVAREYHGGHLDWLDFDVGPRTALAAGADRVGGRNPMPITQTVIPSPVTFRGMPAPRWWEFEDAAVDFGAVEPDPEDLARMLMLEFAISYGNDWFVVPLDLAVGSICRLASLTVTDTFGMRVTIPSIDASAHPAAAHWRMFRHSIDRPDDLPAGRARQPDHFFLAPALMRTMEGKPLEDVLLLRDEAANLAWGVERIVEGPSGRAVDRRQAHQERQHPVGSASSGVGPEGLVWRLATEVPGYWIPLIPVQVDPARSAVAFRQGATLQHDGSRNVQSAQSRVLMPDHQDKLDIHEEEIPREGARVTRGFQYARWLNGTPLLWIGRRKLPGRGEGSSGLQFDTANRAGGGESG